MIQATLLYLLAAVFVIWVWSPAPPVRFFLLVALLLLYLATSKRLQAISKKK